MISLLLIGLYQVAAGAPTAQAAAPSAQQAQPATPAKPAGPKKHCHMESQPNSHLEKRVCMTEDEEKARMEAAQAAMHDLSAPSIACTKP